MLALLEEFTEKKNQNAFLFTNYVGHVSTLIEETKEGIFSIKKLNNNFIFETNPNKKPNLCYFFIVDLEKIEFPQTYVKVMYQDNFKDHDANINKFLALNDFNKIREFRCQRFNITKDSLKMFESSDLSDIRYATVDDLELIFNFYLKFFNEDFEFNYSKENLLDALKSKKILALIKDNKVHGSIIFKQLFNSVLLDYIAVDKECARNDLAFSLVSKMMLDNSSVPFVSLFVDLDNKKAVDFYKRCEFKDNKASLIYFTNIK